MVRPVVALSRGYLISFSGMVGTWTVCGCGERAESGMFMSSKFKRWRPRLELGLEKLAPKTRRAEPYSSADEGCRRDACACGLGCTLRNIESMAWLVSAFWERGRGVECAKRSSMAWVAEFSDDGRDEEASGLESDVDCGCAGRDEAASDTCRWERHVVAIRGRKGVEAWDIEKLRRDDGRSRSSPKWRDPIVKVTVAVLVKEGMKL